jgi:tRNA modification GTPase
MPHLEDTIAALATPTGTSALAVVRITGPEAKGLATEIFGRSPLPRVASRGEYRDRAGVFLDDVLFTFFAGPRSYTGEDVLEISGHGNPWIAQRLLEDLYVRGCRPAEPGEFTRRAWLNGRMDLSQAEAVMDLIQARSERALAAAHRLLRGGMGRELQLVIAEIVRALALVEAYIDFPEEDLPVEDQDGLRRSLQTAREGAGRLLATQRYGDLLRDGVKTVIAGEPNVGKSSLLNRLVGRDRALVSPEPGTTRDYIEERIIVGPHCLRLIDTAGLNSAPAPLEARGMAKTRERIDEADIVLLVLDSSRPAPSLLRDGRAQFDPARTLVVRNKSDLLAAIGSAGWEGCRSVSVSALTGAGIEELTAAVVAMADLLLPPAAPDSIAINARHAHALRIALDCMGQALTKLDSGVDSVLLASDLRGALNALGEIAGKIDNEQVLDLLFASFCIGK